MKEGQIKLFETDHEGQYEKLSLLIKDKEGENNKNGKIETVAGVIQLSNINKVPVGTEESFDYLQKKNPAKLSLIRKEQPEEYQKLCQGFSNGVRYTEK